MIDKKICSKREREREREIERESERVWGKRGREKKSKVVKLESKDK